MNNSHLSLSVAGRRAWNWPAPWRKSDARRWRLISGSCTKRRFESCSLKERTAFSKPFLPPLSRKAQASLESLGVTVMLNSRVKEVNSKGVLAGSEFIQSAHVIWAAGNVASPLLKSLGAPLDSSGRILVRSDLSLSGEPWVFIIGDAAHCPTAEGKPLPGLAAVAMQEGRYVAELVARQIPDGSRSPFVYRDRGILATIGRAKAVAQLGPFALSGVVAWLAWSFHSYIFSDRVFETGFRVMFEWIWYYVTFKPGARLIYWKDRHRMVVTFALRTAPLRRSSL